MMSFVHSRIFLFLALSLAQVLFVKCQDGNSGDELSCFEDGQVYTNRDVWKPEPCRICVCDSGTILCDDVQCDEVINCEKVIIPDGECCPVCQSTFPDRDGGGGGDHNSRVYKGQKGEPGDVPIITGLPGRQGPMGPPGSPGFRGDQGPKGRPGVRGPPGYDGEPGIPGQPGEPGPPGHPPGGQLSSQMAEGFGGDKAAGQHAMIPGQRGEAGARGPPGPNGLAGPPGPQGAPGEPGDTGPMGPAGQRGPEGPPGKPGEDGEAGTSGSTGETGFPGSAVQFKPSVISTLRHYC